MDKKYFVLYITKTIAYEIEETHTEFFKTEDEAIKYKEDYDNEHKREDGKYIPEITSIDYEIENISYEDMKEIMTVEQYEEFFHITLEEP